eukprot:TRINITY_DN776_c0_g1_i1.p1 TRINITY_DN776_c0_g1~~TRINITY_DN776_c0_g1_i1.p1  ORF type:complete len:248 (+),score=52.50 TRINITY_DN776_c0_g1_i1:30-746(+)
MWSSRCRTVSPFARSTPSFVTASPYAAVVPFTAQRTVFTLTPPSYLEQGLKPVISAQTLDVHFNGHHKAYLNKTNELVKGTSNENKKLEEVIVAAKKDNNTALFNNSAQLWNHSFYWSCMAPAKSKQTELPSSLETQIKKDFGSVEDFKKKFSDNAVGNFGSGWTWLVKKDGKLAIWNSSNAETPISSPDQGVPLLTVDVWEHAYYLDHKNKRADYVKGWWDVVNWEHVQKQFESTSH